MAHVVDRHYDPLRRLFPRWRRRSDSNQALARPTAGDA